MELKINEKSSKLNLKLLPKRLRVALVFTYEDSRLKELLCLHILGEKSIYCRRTQHCLAVMCACKDAVPQFRKRQEWDHEICKVS